MEEEKDTKKEDAKRAKAVVSKTRDLPAIPDEKVNQIISLSDDQTVWVKVIEGGFKITAQDKFVKNLVGKIIDINPYLIKFDSGTPSKIPNVTNDLDIPEGYERRCDVKLLIGDEVFGISLPPSSTKFYLSPYLKFLKNGNMRPESVLTRVTSKQPSNQFGTWPVAVFELADSPQQPESSKGYPAEWD